jgi:hypothetical protein
MQGWSAYDQSAELATRARGWSEGNGCGPVWEPDEEEPRWSRRATLMRRLMDEKLTKDNDNLDYMVCDMHILDKEFSDLCYKVMSDMLDGKWVKGLYRDVPKVLK